MPPGCAARPRSPGVRAPRGRGADDFATWCALVEARAGRRPSGRRLCGTRAPEVAEFAGRARGSRHVLHVAAVGAGRAAAPRRRHAARRARAWGSASCTTSRWACTPAGPTPGRSRHVFARGISVGAPPDPYNQTVRTGASRRGDPDRLADLGVRAVPRLVARRSCGTRAASASTTSSACSGCGGSRRGTGRPRAPTSATTTRPWSASSPSRRSAPARSSSARTSARSSRGSRDYLRERGILGTSILWFERDGDGGPPRLPEHWREHCLASVTTHDLPPTAGYLAGRPRPAARPARAADPSRWTRSSAADDGERESVAGDARGPRAAARRRATPRTTVAGAAPLPHV